MDTLDTETVDTPAGTYRIDWIADQYPERPYNEGLGFAYDGGRDRIDVADGATAGDVLNIIRDANDRRTYRSNGVPVYHLSTTAIARYLRIAYGLTGIRIVDYDYTTSAPDTDRDRIYGIAWAPDDATDPDAYTDAAIAEYRAWANGDAYGYQVTDPSNDVIDDCWGYYGYYDNDDERAYTRDQAVSSIRADAAARGKKCALAGAGFIGLI